MNDQIKLHLIMGFTRSPDDGACFVNIRDPKRGCFRQVWASEERWRELQDEKEGYQPPMSTPR